MKNDSNRINLRNGLTFSSRVGEFVDNSISSVIASAFLAPRLEGEPSSDTWYRLPVPEGISGDGSEYYIYIKKGSSSNLCIFFSGGGVAWDEYTAARPITGARRARGLPNFYWNNLRPITQLMNINTGITDTNNPANPFRDWSFIVIAYATGDLHIGNNDFPYTSEDGTRRLVHFRGHSNFRYAMKHALPMFPSADKLLIAGDSAGAFAVPALTDEILSDFYPACRDVTVLSDSGQLMYTRWEHTAREIWAADPSFWKPIHTRNLTMDWYESLYSKRKDTIKYLYACSTHDYLLSAYYNDIVSKRYATNAAVRDVFNAQLMEMCDRFKAMTPKSGIYLNSWPNLIVIYPGLRGGTVHTALRRLNFYSKLDCDVTMAKWLEDAVNGDIYDVRK